MANPDLERLRRRAEELDRQPPVERVRWLLGAYVNDTESDDEIRLRMRGVAVHALARDLRALDTLLTEPQPPGLLSQLVAHDANWSLEDKSDEAAGVLLRQIAQILREELAEAERKQADRMRYPRD